LFNDHDMMRTIVNHLLGVPFEYESHIENIFHLIEKNLSSYHPSSLLDVGCCDGKRTIRLAQYFNIGMDHVYGLDAYDLFTGSNQNYFTVSQIDLEINPLPYQDDMFDLVICNQVLEHLKNYDNVLYQMIRVTKAGGYILIGIPNLAHLINRIYLLFGIQPMCISLDSRQHVRGFTHKAFLAKIHSLPKIHYMDCAGSAIIYPLPILLAKYLSRFFVGICGYVCYLMRKE